MKLLVIRSGTPLIQIQEDSIPDVVQPQEHSQESQYLANGPVFSGATFRFNIIDSGTPTDVEILNIQPGGIASSSITRNGTITNPIGSTVVSNKWGDISSGAGDDSELIQTNTLQLNADTGPNVANGSIGTPGNRVE